MDGRGRAVDNIPIERFWRTLKYEAVYLNTYATVAEVEANIRIYIDWYNNQRRHSGIHNHRSCEVMLGQKITTNLTFAQAR